jgi:hypothetical protein
VSRYVASSTMQVLVEVEVILKVILRSVHRSGAVHSIAGVGNRAHPLSILHQSSSETVGVADFAIESVPFSPPSFVLIDHDPPWLDDCFGPVSPVSPVRIGVLAREPIRALAPVL